MAPSDAPATPAPHARSRQSVLVGLDAVWRVRKQVWALVTKADRRGFGATVLVMMGVSLAETAIAVLLGWFFERIRRMGSGPSKEMLFFAAGALAAIAGAYVAKEAMMLLRRFLAHRTTARIERDMTVRLLSHLLMVNLDALSRDRVGALHGRISRCVEGFVKFLKLAFTDFLPAVMTAAFAIGAALWTEWRVGLVMSGVVPIAVYITIRQVRSQRGIRRELLKSKEGLDGAMVELLGGIEYIRVANTHRSESARLAAIAEQRRVRDLKHSVAMGKFDFLKSVNEGLFHVMIIGYAIFLAACGEIELGKIITFSYLFTNIMRPLKEVHRILDEAYDSSVQVAVLIGMLQEPIDASFSVVTLREPDLRGPVPLLECKNLVVEYVDAYGTRRRALDGVTLSMERGRTIGVAGPSGSGKSTWLRAMLRLIHPTAGNVLVGGVPIAVLSREDIGKLVGYVSQTPFVFSGTIRDNITYEAPSATPEQVQAAAEKAHIHDDIMAMPDGYDTVLAERGSNLSGGQRQRLALARMFLKHPPILILDEGTSALDNISERKIRAAIKNVGPNSTVIMVAHRLTSLSDADCIFVFDRGRVAERGTYEDLVRQNGVFAELVRSAETE